MTPHRPRSARPTRRHHGAAGFTLLGFSLFVFIVSVLVALTVPVLRQLNREARTTTTVNDLRTFARAFQSYAQKNGDWPAATGEPGAIPVGMENYLRGTNWANPTPIGGRYAWSPDTVQQGERYRAAIVITPVAHHPVTTDRLPLTDLDRKIDDGNLATGNLRLGFRHHPVYVLEH